MHARLACRHASTWYLPQFLVNCQRTAGRSSQRLVAIGMYWRQHKHRSNNCCNAYDLALTDIAKISGARIVCVIHGKSRRPDIKPKVIGLMEKRRNYSVLLCIQPFHANIFANNIFTERLLIISVCLHQETIHGILLWICMSECQMYRRQHKKCHSWDLM